MNSIKLLFAGLIGTLASVASAHAADPAGSWPAPAYQQPAPRFQELLSGWYLRGDLGYRLNSVGSIAGTTAVVGSKYDNAVSGSLGWGYKYQWFRADLTIDRGVPSKITGSTAAGIQPQYVAKVGSFSALANFYIDMGTWWGFTPYVGAGAGVTQLKSDSFNDTTQPNGVIGPNGLAVTEPGKAINFSWAAMGGVAYQVAPNWMIDVGYRYLSMGDVAALSGGGTTNNAPVFKNLTSQEVRLGVRFLFD